MNDNGQHVRDLTDEELLEQYEAMVKWWHYNPTGENRPSKFEDRDLRAEVARRMALADRQQANPEF